MKLAMFDNLTDLFQSNACFYHINLILAPLNVLNVLLGTSVNVIGLS